ncbi:MAG: hypothetical protein MUF31_07630 [Akkermansiaceae bacterium]|jgi:hypothetical protein|nr:hypothetical protein [Akkermansiaceae bacterium]
MKFLSKIALLFTIFSTSANLWAEHPADHEWRASWIGPEVQESMDFDSAEWIWVDEEGRDPLLNARAGTHQFRKSFHVDDLSIVRSATAMLTADNRFKLWVNGVEVGSGSDWQRIGVFDFRKQLKSGGNEILVEAGNDDDAGAVNAAGFIGEFRIVQKGLEPINLVTDGSWTASDARLRVIGPMGSGPWGQLAPADSSGHGNLWTCYRRDFNLGAKPETAWARIAVDSKYWLWVNGRLIVREGGLKRGPTPDDTYFDRIDLGPHLVEGRNQIAVLAWFFGKDGFSHKNSGKAGFLFEMQAGDHWILSDQSWKTSRHPAFGQASNSPNFRLAESSVHFDARKDFPDWIHPDFDDQGWDAATSLGSPPTQPWNRLWERSIPQWKDFGLKEYTSQRLENMEGGGAVISARLPYNAQITPWLKVSADEGLLIRMRTDNPANEIFAEYITRGGVQEFESPAWMSGHSVVYEVPAGVEVLELKYRESGYLTDFTGHFRCDNDFLNRLVAKCERTLYINMRDTFFDCPDRERAAWWGDIVIQLAQVFRTFDTRSHALIRKCMYNLANWQRPSKTMFSPIPAGNWDKELPQQMLASIGQYGFWTYYLHTGDKEALNDLYPHVMDYLSIWETDGDGLIVHRSGENGWDWADWGNNVDIRVLDQAWFCLALQGAANMAEVLGKTADARAMRAKRDSVIAATNSKFWNGGAYRDPSYTGATDDRAQGMAVVAGIAGRDKFPAIRKVLSETHHASPYIEKYILEALFLMNAPEDALLRLQKRYKEMVESETTTLWELFSRDGTLNHAWTGGPLTLLHEFVAGVAPTSAAYASYRVMPTLGSLKQVDVGFDTVKGRIDVKIAKLDGSFLLDLDSPVGAEATVCIPVGAHPHHSVSVGGKRVWRGGEYSAAVEGVTAGPEVLGFATFVVGPGKWKFESR